jgi:glycosyltransferase involved in cell wall biosynthesis
MGWVEQPAPRTAAAALRVLTLSRLVPLKRVERVIAAVAMLRASGHDVTLTIAGEGPARRALEAAAGEGTRFLGAVDPAARGELFARADVLVHAAGAIGARTEGAPVAVIEAMGHGLAVVACDAGGVRELTADAALLVPDPAEPTALAAALARLDLSRRADLGARARARALPWRWDATAAWLEAALR